MRPMNERKDRWPWRTMANLRMRETVEEEVAWIPREIYCEREASCDTWNATSCAKESFKSERVFIPWKEFKHDTATTPLEFRTCVAQRTNTSVIRNLRGLLCWKYLSSKSLSMFYIKVSLRKEKKNWFSLIVEYQSISNC